MSETVCKNCGKAVPAGASTCPSCGTQQVVSPGSGPAKTGKQGPLSFYPGQILANRYQVVRLIGRGGMGAIFLVYDKVLNENLALKTLLPQFARDRTIVERFYNEARIARQLSHPGIVRVHDIGMANQVMYISMEYVDGRSLRAVMEEEYGPDNPMPLTTALDIIISICDALQYAHRFTVHRDIKPENVMVLADGSVKLMDFGISKLIAHTRLTMTSMVMGTPQYMSPEQFRDSAGVDARADVYSLGVLLYELLTGELPAGMIRPVSKTRHDILPDMDPVVAKCLDPEPDSRYQSAQELGEALLDVRAKLEAAEDAAPLPPQPPASPSKLLRRVVGVGAVLAVAIAAVVGVAFVLQPGDGEHPGALPAVDAAESEPGSSQSVDAALEQARSLAAEQLNDDPERQIIYEQGERFLDHAAETNGTTQDAAWALQCFAALIWWDHWNPQDTMTFVPPGEITRGDDTFDVSGFFVDRAPVTNHQFIEFARDTRWYVPSHLTGNLNNNQAEQRLTGAPFYYAQAYAAWSASRRIPSEIQWLRLIDAYNKGAIHPDAIAFDGPEWTRTAHRPETTEDPEQLGFGVAMVVWDHETGDRTTLAYEESSPRVGFRCARTLPSSYRVLRSLFEPMAGHQT